MWPINFYPFAGQRQVWVSYFILTTVFCEIKKVLFELSVRKCSAYLIRKEVEFRIAYRPSLVFMAYQGKQKQHGIDFFLAYSN